MDSWIVRSEEVTPPYSHPSDPEFVDGIITATVASLGLGKTSIPVSDHQAGEQ